MEGYLKSRWNQGWVKRKEKKKEKVKVRSKPGMGKRDEWIKERREGEQEKIKGGGRYDNKLGTFSCSSSLSSTTFFLF